MALEKTSKMQSWERKGAYSNGEGLINKKKQPSGFLDNEPQQVFEDGKNIQDYKVLGKKRGEMIQKE